MQGQMSIFDFMQEEGKPAAGRHPEEIKKAAGQDPEETKPAAGRMQEKAKPAAGRMQEKAKTAAADRPESFIRKLRPECENDGIIDDHVCECDYCSKECLIRRGYIWAEGRKRECDWEPGEYLINLVFDTDPEIEATFECFATYPTESGGQKTGKCERSESDKPESCADCPVYAEFYRIAHKFEEAGNGWGLAVALTCQKLKLNTLPQYTADAYKFGTVYNEEFGDVPKNWRI